MTPKDSNDILKAYKHISIITRLHMYVRLRRANFDTIERYVPKKGIILDFGCGHGFFSLYLAEKSKARKVTGVDVSREKIDVAKLITPHKNLFFLHLKNSLTSLDKNSAYDAITISDVLYLLSQSDQEKVIAKACNALKKDGKLIVIEHNAENTFRTFYTRLREFIMTKILRFTEGEHLTFNKHSWWMKLLKQHFEDVKFKKLDTGGFLILYVAKK